MRIHRHVSENPGFKEENGMTEVDFTEDVKVKKFFMRPFVKSFLKKQQELYVSDLKKALEEICL